MINLEALQSEIKSEIDKLKSGHCLLVKLTNYDELHSVISQVDSIITDFDKIIQTVCERYNIKAYTKITYDKIFFIIPRIDQTLLEKIAFEIYYDSQLYINERMAEAFITCRISSLTFPDDSVKIEKIYAQLIGVLTHFKNPGYYQKYDSNVHSIEKIKIEIRKLNMLRSALANKTMKFAYQPIVERKTGKIPYYECLLRMLDENNRFISVGPIIPYAESAGLINVVDHLVLEMAVNELVSSPDISLSVNISNVGVLDDHLLEFAANLLAKHNVASRMIIEITETSLNEDYNKTKIFMDKLHNYGCRFALDDFGSGFTSFRQLQNLPIDIIKIDGSYVRNITNNHHSKYFVEALIKISEDLGIKTVAEFVENGEIAKFLIDIKVDGMQGNFFSPASDNRE